MSKEKILHQDPKEIAKYIISQTPIGLLDSSLENLKVLVKEEILKSPEIIKELTTYKETHLIPISIPNVKNKVIFCPLNKDNNDFYYDQIQKIRFKLNDKGEPENIEEYEINTEIFMRVCRRIDEYIKKYYNKDLLYYNIYHNTFLDTVQVLIVGKIVNKKNFWTGEWISAWCLDIEQKRIDGEIRINTLYYEDGNVQFNYKKNFEKAITIKDVSTLADEFMEFIEKNENNTQNKIEEINQNLSEEYVKPLRKRISIIAKEMNWSLDQIQFKQG